MADVGIFGTSGHAREVGDIAWALGHRVIYVAKSEVERAAWTFADEVMLESQVCAQRGIVFSIGIGSNRIRQQVAQRFAADVRFANLVHPAASFGKGQRDAIDARRGVVVCAGVSLSNNVRIGDFTIFNRNATVGHDAHVEDFANVAPGACISGNVHLGTRCWVGAGAVVNQGTHAEPLRIGADTVIGSGAVVLADCEAGATYAGVPARKIK
jgi:sugar O-acyltransferase (sialic acid O-acetyltransferase NeuD family)